MRFDRSKAMRNAERYVAQGKIRAAISEYRSVVENDPRDIATMNMLGDLLAKNLEKKEAVQCYLQVAEHYHTQGFAQKAIAVYNKITRIQPDSLEVSMKLAELHKGKGSLAEARSHYATLAQHYEKNGRRLEALAMYKQIALLDPNNTEVCMNLAESYVRENQKEEAVEAYAEAGARFARQGQHEEAVKALMKGFDINATDMRILDGVIKAQSALGRAGKAAMLLEEILEGEPYNREILMLLIECCLDSQNAEGAEKAINRLVEIEPANHDKYLELIRIYLNANDVNSAARILSMSAEYLLAAGQGDECSKWISEILERDADHVTGLRLLVRYNTWANDENGTRLALERLYTAASNSGEADDERAALERLVIMKPHETRYRDRLSELSNESHQQTVAVGPAKFDTAAQSLNGNGANPPNGNGRSGHKASIACDDDTSVLSAEIVMDSDPTSEPRELTPSEEEKVQREIESVSFYIENDYNDLAEKAIAALTEEYGNRPEFNELRKRIGLVHEDEPAITTVEVTIEPDAEVVANSIGIDEIRSEFGLGSAEDTSADDFETHYNTAIAYQEMGLVEDAIREFQDAANLCKHGDGTRRFFYCANMLGHCFLECGKGKHAVTWFGRALETADITDDERVGVWYELGLAHEMLGEEDSAAEYFEKVYAENVDFRDVSVRVREKIVG